MRCRGLLILATAGLVSSCAPKVPPLAQPLLTPQMRMAAADADLRDGCLDCLEHAYREYSTLRPDPIVGDAATQGTLRAAVLIAVRRNELGLLDTESLGRTRELLPAQPPPVSMLLDVGDALSAKPAGFSRGGVSDRETLALANISRNHLPWAVALRELMPADLAADYLWLSLSCGEYGFDVPDRQDRRTVLADAFDVPLIRFKIASACSGDRPALQAVLDRDPRFVEANYFLGLRALAGQVQPGVRPGPPDLEGADALFRTAYAWRQDWPVLTLSIANVALTAEDFERAFEFFDKTLALVPNQPEALMGTIRTLTYLGRHVEAIAAADRLIGTNRNPGEGRYWRALNNERLQQHDEAWDDIGRAASALVNADVPKLAGIIAINRHELEVARQRLELSLSRRRSDCETLFYLQAILVEQRQWNDAARVAADAGGCFDAELVVLSNELEAVRSSTIPAERRARQVARREQQIASEIRMRASSWFDAAAANFNLSRRDEARRFVEKLVDDEQFADRARDLLARLNQP